MGLSTKTRGSNRQFPPIQPTNQGLPENHIHNSQTETLREAGANKTAQIQRLKNGLQTNTSPHKTKHTSLCAIYGPPSRLQEAREGLLLDLPSKQLSNQGNTHTHTFAGEEKVICINPQSGEINRGPPPPPISEPWAKSVELGVFFGVGIASLVV